MARSFLELWFKDQCYGFIVTCTHEHLVPSWQCSQTFQIQGWALNVQTDPVVQLVITSLLRWVESWPQFPITRSADMPSLPNPTHHGGMILLESKLVLPSVSCFWEVFCQR